MGLHTFDERTLTHGSSYLFEFEWALREFLNKLYDVQRKTSKSQFFLWVLMKHEIRHVQQIETIFKDRNSLATKEQWQELWHEQKNENF
jgi:hypothetical protein